MFGKRYNARLACAGVAQLVERNLAKVEVASSRLVSRSKFSGEGIMLSLFSFCRRMGLRRTLWTIRSTPRHTMPARILHSMGAAP
jgi:hypothetical protein